MPVDVGAFLKIWDMVRDGMKKVLILKELLFMSVLRVGTKWAIFLCAAVICFSGCNNKILDPTQIGRFRPVPAINVILDSLGVAEESPATYENAEEPRPVDVMAYEVDYVLGAGDTIRISIFELLQEGGMFINDYPITESGKISIPDVGMVEAAGLTETELEEVIKDIVSPTILKEPSVTVILVDSQTRTFSILGDAVLRPSRYGIPRSAQFRLTEALATSGGVSQFNVSYIYISRPVTGREAISEVVESESVEELVAEPAEELLVEPEGELPDERLLEGLIAEPTELDVEDEFDSEEDILEIIVPRSHGIDNRLIIASGQMVTGEDDSGGADSSGRESVDEPINSEHGGQVEWIFQNGKWVPVKIDSGGWAEEPEVKDLGEKAEPLTEQLPADFDWDQADGGGGEVRLIKIPTDKLFSGDPRYNIVIRPGDIIHIPYDIIGEFYIGGNVNRGGSVPITGRPITLKIAIQLAGGLGPLASPKNCEIVRRLGKNKEEFVMVDLEKIARGDQPDFFIKPNDSINVGTDPTARWRAVLRNAFRATYGFGFIYDRNFGDRDFGTSRPIPNWF